MRKEASKRKAQLLRIGESWPTSRSLQRLDRVTRLRIEVLMLVILV